ncbi:uncharacterized protein LOC101736353 isoform X1 [Bombyx mori]|uniref:Chitin-binding type-2 domain-containing protein n=1 Tax=Bombyx mori TaxID=7091 RepID=A0A8R2QWX4_BOMMO|nr:uncharacterized protein LOC101736353 isoform X1 [Bombyx mori]
MKRFLLGGFLFLSVLVEIVQPTCVLESDFGFKINCAFKKSGLFRVRNLGGIKAHASLGFSLGDELGFEQSLTNLDPSRRRSVNIKNGAPPNLVADTSRLNAKQEKRAKQNRIMMRPVAPPLTRPDQAAMDKLTSLHRRVSTMQPIVVPNPAVETPTNVPTQTMAKPMPMGVPPFRPLPPKEDTLKVLPITSSTRKNYAPLQIPESKGPGLAYQSEIYPQSHNQISKMVSQMTAVQYAPVVKIKPTPVILDPFHGVSTLKSINPFVPMPAPTQALPIIPSPATHAQSVHKTNPVSTFVDPVPHHVHNIASSYVYNTKKVDDYNTITGYGDDTVLKFNKEDINAKIAEIAKVGNISMEAVEAAIALRQQQLLNKYAHLPAPPTTSSTTTTTQPPVVFQPEPEILTAALPQKPQSTRQPTSGKVMNAPREYYPVGYEKNFDDHFQSKVDLPDTSFHCGDQKYFPGLYGDESLGCMVFHVCALTDDGLVMKSFLCPESTLFDQTILKCNWWFYVDCKNTRKLYDTNIPVSKSYQLMKALTFFSSYKKDNNMQDDGRSPNPEDVDGIKEAISILENQDTTKTAQTETGSDGLHIITPQPLIDERSNRATPPAPVYRGDRQLGNTTRSGQNSTQPHSQTVADSSQEPRPFSAETDRDKKHRRRMTLRFSNSTTSTKAPSVSTTHAVEVIQQEIQPIENLSPVRRETLADQLGTDARVEEAPPVKRVYRSSAEKYTKEPTVAKHEELLIVTPTTFRLVGEATQKAAIESLDRAVLGGTVGGRRWGGGT